MKNPFKTLANRLRSGLKRSERGRVVEAIGRAEGGNRGEVRVHIEPECPADEPLDRAREVFGELGMHETDEQTGVLLYIADVDHKCAVFAGEGIFETRDPEFWHRVVDEVANGYKRGAPVEGIVHALEEVGAVLREQVPGEDAAGNELPDEVSVGQ
jgi:uncharacterized membrane protein